jgi:hypothetical protein
LFIAAAYPFELQGQTAKPQSLEELAVYKGPDRLQVLVNGAKKEGKVVWYTAMAGRSYKELARVFEAKYGITVEAYRDLAGRHTDSVLDKRIDGIYQKSDPGLPNRGPNRSRADESSF